MVTSNDSRGGHGEHLSVLEEPVRTIVIVATSGGIPKSLQMALLHEFPFVRIVCVRSPDDALNVNAPLIGLVLVDPAFIETVEASADMFAGAFPEAIFAEILSGRSAPGRSVRNPRRLVRSALSMNLRLDLWLSIVQVMFRGGEYSPPREANHRDGSALESLTARELEVLELVSLGRSNRMIASSLGVSEHTIKIHLHSIISKLGASNRFEAALHLMGQNDDSRRLASE